MHTSQMILNNYNNHIILHIAMCQINTSQVSLVNKLINRITNKIITNHCIMFKVEIISSNIIFNIMHKEEETTITIAINTKQIKIKQTFIIKISNTITLVKLISFQISNNNINKKNNNLNQISMNILNQLMIIFKVKK